MTRYYIDLMSLEMNTVYGCHHGRRSLGISVSAFVPFFLLYPSCFERSIKLLESIRRRGSKALSYIRFGPLSAD